MEVIMSQLKRNSTTTNSDMKQSGPRARDIAYLGSRNFQPSQYKLLDAVIITRTPLQGNSAQRPQLGAATHADAIPCYHYQPAVLEPRYACRVSYDPFPTIQQKMRGSVATRMRPCARSQKQPSSPRTWVNKVARLI